jgi:hypothetical protein
MRDKNPETDRGLKPPPNYFSRKVQLKLLLLVGLLVAVVVIASEAADPANYKWWSGQSQQEESGELSLDMLPKPTATLPVQSKMPSPRAISDFHFPAVISKPNSLDPAKDKALVIERTRKDIWSQVRENMDPPERMALLSSFDFLRSEQPIPQAQKEALGSGLEKATAAWNAYLWDAAQSLTAGGEASKPWREILDSVGSEWKNTVLPALTTANKEPPVSIPKEDTRWAVLDAHQRTLDQLATADIKDSMTHQAEEAEAFFRMLYELDSHSQQEINENTTGVVKFLELDEQADRYRGKLVTVNGTIRQGTQLIPRRNPYGIEKYYRLSIKPTSGPNSPLLVYTLNLPESIEDLPVGKVEKLRHEASVTGYFFNKHAYLGQKDILTAPLILAKAPISLEEQLGEEPIAQVPYVFLASMGIVMLLISVCVAIGIYRLNRPGGAERDLPQQLNTKELESLPEPGDFPSEVM